MKAFSKRLTGLGFTAITRSVFACRAADVVHAVFVSKDRHGDAKIHVVACPAGFFEPNEAFSVDQLRSPACGDVSPRGVVSSWTWEGGQVDADTAIAVLLGFFSRFATVDDVRRALQGAYVTPYAEERLQRDIATPACVLALPLANYPVPGGALALADATGQARAQLERALAPLGFAIAQMEDAVAVRQRGNMFDGVRAVMDAFGTHVTLACFPWPAAMARADKRWKDTYYPMVSYDVMREDGRLLILPLNQFVALEPEQLRAMVEEGIARSARVENHLAFADLLDGQWASLAGKLRHIAL
jgi:hypothetical protein